MAFGRKKNTAVDEPVVPPQPSLPPATAGAAEPGGRHSAPGAPKRLAKGPSASDQLRSKVNGVSRQTLLIGFAALLLLYAIPWTLFLKPMRDGYYKDAKADNAEQALLAPQEAVVNLVENNPDTADAEATALQWGVPSQQEPQSITSTLVTAGSQAGGVQITSIQIAPVTATEVVAQDDLAATDASGDAPVVTDVVTAGLAANPIAVEFTATGTSEGINLFFEKLRIQPRFVVVTDVSLSATAVADETTGSGQITAEVSSTFYTTGVGVDEGEFAYMNGEPSDDLGLVDQFVHAIFGNLVQGPGQVAASNSAVVDTTGSAVPTVPSTVPEG